MGTEKEQGAPAWDLRGPDADGAVWLDVDQDGERNSFNLGPFDDVGCRLADWLGAQDFGDRPCEETQIGR